MNSLLEWYDHNRRDLPWRSCRTPYGTWISEAMLQQTRVATVLDYYPRFLKALPSPQALASASEEQVLKLWEGLGYYSRARNLMRGAEYICANFDGKLPSDPDLLLKIPGIGPYMAGAIASQAFGKAEPAVDGNCIRIYCRLYALPMVPSDRSTYNEIYSRVKHDIPEDAPGDFNEALMDFGSLICTPKSPKCSACPFAMDCSANLLGKQEDFPLKKEKKETPVEEHTILKIYVGDKILVRKRPSTGLLAGLYELIDLDGHLTSRKVKAWLAKNLQVQAEESDIRVLGPSTHVFSHLRWKMLGYEIHIPGPDTKKDAAEIIKKTSEEASRLGLLVSSAEYQELAFASALRAYR